MSRLEKTPTSHDMEFAGMTVWFRGLQTGYWSTNSGWTKNRKVAQKLYEDGRSYDKQHHQRKWLLVSLWS